MTVAWLARVGILKIIPRIMQYQKGIQSQNLRSGLSERNKETPAKHGRHTYRGEVWPWTECCSTVRLVLQWSVWCQTWTEKIHRELRPWPETRQPTKHCNDT